MPRKAVAKSGQQKATQEVVAEVKQDEEEVVVEAKTPEENRATTLAAAGISEEELKALIYLKEERETAEKISKEVKEMTRLQKLQKTNVPHMQDDPKNPINKKYPMTIAGNVRHVDGIWRICHPEGVFDTQKFIERKHAQVRLDFWNEEKRKKGGRPVGDKRHVDVVFSDVEV